MINYDIVIIGGGPAGLAAAIEAKKNGAKDVLIIEREMELGGVLRQCVHSGFGIHIFKEELTGPEYAEIFIDKVKKLEIEYKLDTMVLSIDREKHITASSENEGFIKIKAKAIILATGCMERVRDSIGIFGKRPAGVFTAGTAQRFINIDGYLVGKKIVILGAGDIGLIMARRMEMEGAEVIAVVEKANSPGGSYRNVVQCLQDFDIPLLLNHTITEIQGKERVEAVIVCQVDKGGNPLPETSKKYECDTVLLSAGLIPEAELARNASIEIKSTGGIKIDNLKQTSKDGIFACGNVVKVHDLVDNVTKEAEEAGRNAALYIKN
ncbi:FAD-dependent pyridine nucleotide-disulfide oxidoreductase [Clostridium pasteurianum DSM 525 = ATCC 6013]|uniref:FAD-dependent pyridine nucleotide-disulfide oxidoreductase n=1 Tax=Clostridium pasteurianum DSM 525 = ATCC 6013 TaxID=1262449 RepID=A0A0H3J4M2_CLOPA|nr:NAD(P)/FAD-dependent oxidoreductase [Clostridium pasteurianum]AJA48439.1 FAD-dependent pyridine nucleotide-disulfide oxidoreductase [Clostridium pasteurianum DSM 525 = ATCC 6013]AJA52427.1 FAD-dependent pyridine nucleotide-disulfide oxidoreductase [Clostridium pasteurianum DSM 525 = ATCC 6013]AOZ75683.1 oxidoreductase [Clostridium pasteurianum DSM 525 = ATCC 6013]AOZ79479.1 oxidoreductase [Clostridium pasteurianum]ELP60411.1 FAD-dependent pyridine nucleotide-disulfide oxidoreductase [Clostr